MGDIITKLREIKEEAMMGHDGEVINRINELLRNLELMQEIEIAPAQEDIIPCGNEKQILITGDNANVRIFMAGTKEN